MTTTFLPPESPTGYLIDGTPVFDLHDVAATHGMTYAECEDALREFIECVARQRGGMESLRAGVFVAGDPRIHRLH